MTAKRQIWIPILSILIIIITNVHFQFRAGIDNQNFGDSEDYLFAARSIYTDTGYPRIFESFPFFRAPGYPFVIATIWKITSFDSISPLKYLNVICVGLIAAAVYFLARRRLSVKISSCVMLVASLNPFITMQSQEVGTETITTFLFIAFLLILTQRDLMLKSSLLALIILCISAVRPEYFFFCSSSTVIYYTKLNKNPRKIIWVFIIPIICINYWGLQNKEVTGSYIPFTNAATFQLWMGSTDIIDRNYPLTFQDTLTFNEKQNSTLRAEIHKIESSWGDIDVAKKVGERSNLWLNEFRKNVAKDPKAYVFNLMEKALIFWRPFISPTAYSPVLVYFSFVYLFPFMLLTLIGCIRAIRQKHFVDEIVIFINCLIQLTLVHALQMPDFRYRVPVFFPMSTVIVIYCLNQFPLVKLKTKCLIIKFKKN